ncbi:unnamed protein product [Notodromas monacha]|uniref:Uncharacterized protein n=1 Tax=Notodromas monacha TaxID=399045 RepID=A0A7R9BFC3_9CRUS|nr:unnamed protein product [Notodromas monacha]CAG0914367.1 unnamed protein product [Notodromas monacha]
MEEEENVILRSAMTKKSEREFEDGGVSCVAVKRAIGRIIRWRVGRVFLPIECIDEEVRKYIQQSLSSMENLSKRCCLEKICLVVTEDDEKGCQKPIEKFVVQLRSPVANNSALVEADPAFIKLEQDFRAALLKVSRLSKGVGGTLTEAEPCESRSFAIWTVMENVEASKFLSDDSEQHDFPWIHLEKSVEEGSSGEISGKSVIPIRNFASPIGDVDMFVLACVDPSSSSRDP